MADTQVTLDIGGAVSASLSLITSVQNILTGSRSATIEIDNNTNLTLTYAGGHNSHGGWAKIPDLSIKPMSASVLGVQNQGGSIMTGAEGWVMYGADDSSLLFSVGWDNPYIGANSGSARLGFSKAGQYMVRFFVGNGNTQVPFRFVLLPNSGSLWPQIKDISDGGFFYG
jgi:hypothetical protein